MSFNCCKNCVAPKRHPGCHSECEEYKACNEEHLRVKAIIDHDKHIDGLFKGFRMNGAIRSIRRGYNCSRH